MKILVLAPHPFYQDRGTPMDVDLLVRALSARGEKVDLVTYHEGEDREYPNVNHHRIRAPDWLRNVRPGFSFRKLICDVFLFFMAWRLVAQNQYDVIHAGEESVFMAMFFKRFYRLPYVYDMDSSIGQQVVEKFAILQPVAPILNWCEGRAIRGSTAVAPVCHALADLAHTNGATAIVTLHDISQLQESDFDPLGTLRKRLEIDGLMGMYVGNLEKYQGVDLLLESFPFVRESGANVDLVIAGGQSKDIQQYQRKSRTLGIEPFVHFLGPWPAENLGPLLASADFLIAPRIKGINTPMKIFPYLHSGRPVLATELPTHTQLLDDSVAMLAPADPEGFGLAMVRLAEDEDLRARLGAAGRDFVQQYHTYDHYEVRVGELYDLVDARRPSLNHQAIQP